MSNVLKLCVIKARPLLSQVLNIGSGGFDIFKVNLTSELVTVRGQQHSFSTHERMFLWKCQSFWESSESEVAVRAIWTFYHTISQHRDATRSVGETSFWFVIRGPGYMNRQAHRRISFWKEYLLPCMYMNNYSWTWFVCIINARTPLPYLMSTYAFFVLSSTDVEVCI